MQVSDRSALKTPTDAEVKGAEPLYEAGGAARFGCLLVSVFNTSAIPPIFMEPDVRGSWKISFSFRRDPREGKSLWVTQFVALLFVKFCERVTVCFSSRAWFKIGLELVNPPKVFPFC